MAKRCLFIGLFLWTLRVAAVDKDDLDTFRKLLKKTEIDSQLVMDPVELNTITKLRLAQ